MTDLIEKFDGRQILIGEELHEVRGRLVGRAAIQIQSPSGVLHEMPVQDFHVEVALGHVVDPDPDWEPNRLPSGADRNEQKFRLAVIKRSTQLQAEGFNWDDRIAILQREFAKDERFGSRQKIFPSKRTIQIWSRSLRERGGNGLVDKRHRSGNRVKRHDAVFEGIVFDLLEERYLESDRYTVRTLTRLAQVKYLDRCRNEKISPSEHGEKVVRSLIDALPHRDVVRRRIGGEAGARRLLKAARFEKVVSPFERVEIDSTQADIYVVIDDDGNVARPHICAAIDCATGVVVGLTVNLANTNAAITAETLKEVMTPTSPEFFDLHDIEFRFQAFGRPLIVVSDHGPENSGLSVEGVVEAALLEFRKAIPKKPERKPYIERFMDTFNGFVTTLPGASTTSEMPNKTRVEKGSKEASITFDQFVSLVQKWRFDVYAQTDRRRIQNPLRTTESPFNAWHRLSNEHLVPEPPTIQEIRELFFAGHARRKLHLYGVELNRIQYFGRGTSELLDLYGPGAYLDIRFDPTSIRSILVKHEDDQVYVEIPAKDPDIPAISIAELKAIQESLKGDDGGNLSAARILSAMTEGFHRKPGKPTTKARAAKHNAISRDRDKQAIARSKAPRVTEETLVEGVAKGNRPLVRPKNVATAERRKS